MTNLVSAGENAWLVRLSGVQHSYFPYSVCAIDDKSIIIQCPKWLAVKKEIEGYIDYGK